MVPTAKITDTMGWCVERVEAALDARVVEGLEQLRPQRVGLGDVGNGRIEKAARLRRFGPGVVFG